MEQIPVYYDSRMVVDSRGYSPSASKPKAVVDDWITHGLAINVQNFDSASLSDLAFAHHPSYIDGIFGGTITNGHGNTYRDIADSCLWTVGSMMAACKHALSHRVACSPSSGFHHAGYARSGGFCTFNGLMVAAISLLDINACGRIGILDFDFHFGDGTEDIINRKAEYGEDIAHVTNIARSDFEFIEEMIAEMRADLIIYQAGADQHIDDPLGGLFTTEELAERDRRVFQYCSKSLTPIAWNLAGGYQRDAQGSIGPVLEIHRNTMSACLDVFST